MSIGPSRISEEKKYLSSVLVSNDCPSSFVRKLAKTTSVTANKEPAQEFKSTAVLPYIKGVSEVLRHCLQQQGIRTVLQSKRRDLHEKWLYRGTNEKSSSLMIMWLSKYLSLVTGLNRMALHSSEFAVTSKEKNIIRNWSTLLTFYPP